MSRPIDLTELPPIDPEGAAWDLMTAEARRQALYKEVARLRAAVAALEAENRQLKAILEEFGFSALDCLAMELPGILRRSALAQETTP